jgi:catalase (peroxidase I)
VPKDWTGPLQYMDKNDAEEFVMMLPTDVALLQDSAYKRWVQIFAESERVWKREFAEAYAKLLELGVTR